MIRGRFTLVVALPKGRNFVDSYQALNGAGLELPAIENERALLHGKEGGIAILELRNHDVPTYVDLGIADVGVVGKDVLLESGRDVYEPVDLGTGACRLSLIRHPEASAPIPLIPTKFPLFIDKILRDLEMSPDIFKLGEIFELPPLPGLADAVVDVVQTGATLKPAGLIEMEVLAHSTARFIVNRQSLKLKRDLLRPLIERLRANAPKQSG